MNTNLIRLVVIMVAAVLISIFLGLSSATDQGTALLWVSVGVAVSICLAAGNRIWMLVPVASSLAITLPWIPGDFHLRDVSIIVMLGFGILLMTKRKITWKPRVRAADFYILSVIGILVLAFLRYPAGVAALGTNQVGGRAYFEVAITAAGWLFFSGLKADIKQWNFVIFLSIMLSIGISSMHVLVFYVPAIAVVTGPTIGIWGSYVSELKGEVGPDEGEADRKKPLAYMGKSLSSWLVYKISPLRALFKPNWMVVMLCALAAGAMSGFRSEVASIGLTFAVAIGFYHGFKGIITASFISVLAISGLLIISTAISLPPNIQRALSFLPGQWDKNIVRDTEVSTDWRVDMWKEALYSRDHIKNKLIGDGMGMSQKDFETQQHLKATQTMGVGGFDIQQEYFLISGNYHSGPVSTIKTIGYLGFSLLVVAFIAVIVKVSKTINKAKNTPWFPITIFFGLPCVVFPFSYIFIYGHFQSGIPEYIGYWAVFSMVMNSFEDWINVKSQ
ncbi:MAG: hypothetical protein ACON5H_05715 [Akkermansiaceae bacterium]